MLSTNFDEGKKKQIKDDKERFSTWFRTLVTLINWHIALYAAFLVTMFARNPCFKNIRNGNRSGSGRVFFETQTRSTGLDLQPGLGPIIKRIFFLQGPNPPCRAPSSHSCHIFRRLIRSNLKKKKKKKIQIQIQITNRNYFNLQYDIVSFQIKFIIFL